MSLVSLNVNIDDEKDHRPSPKIHPINTNTRPRQLSPFNDQLADFREPPPPLSGRNSLTDHKKKLLTFPKLITHCVFPVLRSRVVER